MEPLPTVLHWNPPPQPSFSSEGSNQDRQSGNLKTRPSQSLLLNQKGQSTGQRTFMGVQKCFPSPVLCLITMASVSSSGEVGLWLEFQTFLGFEPCTPNLTYSGNGWKSLPCHTTRWPNPIPSSLLNTLRIWKESGLMNLPMARCTQQLSNRKEGLRQKAHS